VKLVGPNVAAAVQLLAVVQETPQSPVRLPDYWAAACLDRAAGRLTGDQGALARSLAGWDGIDARLEWACTLLLMDGRADEGHAELATLGCQPPA
jgi:hypothetical protein